MTFRATSWICAVLLALPVDAALDAGDSPGEGVGPIVVEALESEQSDLNEFELRLAELGPTAIGPLFELLVAGTVVVHDEQLALGSSGEELILNALKHMPHSGVTAWLEHLRTPLDHAQLRAGHLVLGALGEASDLTLLVSLTTPERIEAPMSPSVRRTFTDAAAQIFERYKSETWLVTKHYDSAPAGLRASLLQAAERAEMTDAVGLYAELLGVHSKLDILLLGQIARAGDPWREDLRAIEAVRGRLISQDERELTAAVLALAAFEDAESVDELIALMEDAGPRLRGHLNDALVMITGRDFRGDAERWRSWHLDLALWWRTEGQELLRDLHGTDGARAAAAVNRLGQHRLFRREFEGELLRSLDSQRPELCALGCAVLGRIGSPRALPRLEDLATNLDQAVAAAAQRALEEISRRAQLEFVEPPSSNSR